MAFRPKEKKVYSWRHPDERDDPKAMVWDITLKLYEDFLFFSFSQELARSNFDNFFDHTIVQHVKKLVIPALEDGKEDEVIEDAAKIREKVAGLPVQYGQYLQAAILGEGDILEKGLLGN